MNLSPTPSQQAIEQMVTSANDFLRRGQHDRYLDLMQRAAGMNAANYRIPVEVGISFLRRYDYVSAGEWFDRAVGGTPQQVGVLESIAFVCRDLNRYDLAEHYLQQASAHPEATANTFAYLAEMYERSRQADRAIEAVKHALSVQPDNPMALLVGARLERSAGRLGLGERMVRAVLGRTDPELWSARIRAGYELGLNLDEQCRYEHAMAAFANAKTADVPPAFRTPDVMLKSRHPSPRAAAELSTAILQRWSTEARDGGTPPRRLALLCGHARSGTTLLEQMLDSHPSIVSVEETYIFSEAFRPLKNSVHLGTEIVTALDGFDPTLLERQREWYFNAVEKFQGEPINGRLLVDKNPALTGHLMEVLRFFPDIRLIVALRDPRDVCLSNFMNPPAITSLQTLEAAAQAYAATMAFWLAIKPRLQQPAFEIRYEDMVADPEHWAKQALRFLAVDWNPAVLQSHLHARQKLVRSPSYMGVVHPISNRAVGRWKNYERYIQPILPILAPFIKAFGYEE